MTKKADQPFHRGVKFLVGGKEIHVQDEMHDIPPELFQMVVNQFEGHEACKHEPVKGTPYDQPIGDWHHAMLPPGSFTAEPVRLTNYWGPADELSLTFKELMAHHIPPATLTPRTVDDFIAEIISFPADTWREEVKLDIAGQELTVYKTRAPHLDFAPLDEEQDAYLDALATDRVHRQVTAMKNLTDEMNLAAICNVIVPERHQR